MHSDISKGAIFGGTTPIQREVFRIFERFLRGNDVYIERVVYMVNDRDFSPFWRSRIEIFDKLFVHFLGKINFLERVFLKAFPLVLRFVEKYWKKNDDRNRICISFHLFFICDEMK